MRIMPANNGKAIVHYYAGRYAHLGLLGHIYSPAGWRQPVPWLPYALDNGAYVAWSKQHEWDAEAFVGLCEKARRCGQPPLWVVVPDVVGDREGTLARWHEWQKCLRVEFRFRLAFAVQDGMTVDDVPREADVVFIGGTTAWKDRNIRPFCATYGHVHVGRINTERWLWYCHDCGAESCDGTGWLRGDRRQLNGLLRYLGFCAGETGRHRQLTMEELTCTGS